MFYSVLGGTGIRDLRLERDPGIGFWFRVLIIRDQELEIPRSGIEWNPDHEVGICMFGIHDPGYGLTIM